MGHCGAPWIGFAATGMPSALGPADQMRKGRIVFVAALEREVAPLLRIWKCRVVERDGHRYRLFENGEAALICGGMGPEAARRATETVIQEVGPVRIVSVGFAGALDAELKVADIVEPAVVINSHDGVRTEIGCGRYALVSYPTVVGKQQKRKLREAYGAALVDMEAAAVAQGAQARGIEFAAIKVISDDAEFTMPEMDRFVTRGGQFREARFALHVAIRPWLWAATIMLARNSERASRALCSAISDYLKRDNLALPA
jgi:adenosylhomocysteine nucleosidase